MEAKIRSLSNKYINLKNVVEYEEGNLPSRNRYLANKKTKWENQNIDYPPNFL